MECNKRDGRPKTRQTLGKSGRRIFLLLLLVQNCLCVNAAAEALQRRTEVMERMRHEVSGKRRQIGGGHSTKVEAAKRRRQD